MTKRNATLEPIGLPTVARVVTENRAALAKEIDALAADAARLRARGNPGLAAGCSRCTNACASSTPCWRARFVPAVDGGMSLDWPAWSGPESVGGTFKGMRSCWATSLGGCGSKLSREHLVSAVLWTGPTVIVSGLPWCKDGPKTVGVESITARILCRDHNSALSDTDSAAGAAFEALKRAGTLNDERSKLRPRKWKVVRYEIDGARLERWFLKTLINIVVSQEAKGSCWAVSGSALDQPPDVLVRAAFGREQLAKPMGLYGVGAVGETVTHVDGVELATLLRPADNALVGGLFTFFGFRFLLYLDSVPVPPSLPLPSGQGWRPSDALYHLGKIDAKVAGKLSHYTHILWNLE